MRLPSIQSELSGPPSAYQQRKRVRLSSSPVPSPSHSRPSSSHNAHNTGSIPNRHSLPPSPAARALNRTSFTRERADSTRGSNRSLRQSVLSAVSPSVADSRRERRSLSEVSIPVSAIVAPHPPSLGRSSAYHMRDPRRPPRVHSTPWSLRFRSSDEEGSPRHAWIFFIGFILYPLWWVAAFLPRPETRRVGGTDTEKAVTLDDPQVEHGECPTAWRCAHVKLTML